MSTNPMSPLPPRTRREKRPLQPLRLAIFGIGSFAIALGVVVGIMALTYSPSDPDKGFARDLQGATAGLPLAMAHGTKLGSDSAPVKLVTFEDFQCLFCLKFAATQEPTLIDEYVKTGKVQVVWESLVRLGDESTASANAAECAADQGKFWQYYNKLYQVQAEAGQYANEVTNVGRFSAAKLKQYAAGVGLDPARFDKCVDSRARLDRVTQDQQAAAGYGITSTPGFVINGVSHGSGAPASLDGWRKILDNAVSDAG